MNNFDMLLDKFNDRKFDNVMKHAGRLGNVGTVFVCSVGLLKYTKELFPHHQFAGWILGLIAILGSFILLAMVGLGIWKHIRSKVDNFYFAHLLGCAIFVFCLLLGVGGMIVSSHTS